MVPDDTVRVQFWSLGTKTQDAPLEEVLLKSISTFVKPSPSTVNL
jgi:hypothetical protein